MDPRVTTSAADLRGQTEASLVCYRAYHELQAIREAIDARPAAARQALASLRGAGSPGDQDVLYGSITAVAADRETVVGLQQKFLFMMTLVQGADVKPTPQALAGIQALERTLGALKTRWETSR